MKKIALPRLILYLSCFSICPFLALLFLFFSHLNQIEAVHQAIEAIQFEAATKQSKQALNLAIKHHFKDADHFYIDKYMESLVLLEPEIEMLEKILANQNQAEDVQIKKRLDFLTTTANQIAFSEGIVQSYPMFQETIETLIHPVEVNGTDIQKILSRIEGIEMEEEKLPPYRPQLIITEFKLDKKKINEKNEVFLLNMKLVKREFI